jgi:hypothetical protein
MTWEEKQAEILKRLLQKNESWVRWISIFPATDDTLAEADKAKMELDSVTQEHLAFSNKMLSSGKKKNDIFSE